jgi:glycosyltransferase involved in cell wall biosynthesis
MRRIVWQPESSILVDSFNDRSVSNENRGGYIYEYHAALSLSAFYDIVMDAGAPRRPRESSLRYWQRLRSSSLQGDVFIMSPPVINLGPRKKHAVNIGMLHHIYFSRKERSLEGRFSLQLIKRRLRELDLIVVVSRYWADFLDSIGCRTVRVIYNGFDPAEFASTDQEVSDLLSKNGLPKDKPLVHIGYADRTKGVVEVFESLKHEDLTLVMTGPLHRGLDLPVHWLHLNRKDYLRLLCACDVAVNMSRIEEGWSRVAHEALLSRTPVIGSGSGGMRELLEGAGQLICSDVSQLPGMVKEVLDHKQVYAEKGFNFASRFTHETFEGQWISLLREMAP